MTPQRNGYKNGQLLNSQNTSPYEVRYGSNSNPWDNQKSSVKTADPDVYS